MTIEEMQDAKQKLNREIAVLLRKFSDETGLIISRVELTNYTASNVNGQRVAHEFTVETEAVL